MRTFVAEASFNDWNAWRTELHKMTPDLLLSRLGSQSPQAGLGAGEIYVKQLQMAAFTAQAAWASHPNRAGAHQDLVEEAWDRAHELWSRNARPDLSRKDSQFSSWPLFAEWCKIWRNESISTPTLSAPVVALGGGGAQLHLTFQHFPGPRELSVHPHFAFAPWDPTLRSSIDGLINSSALKLDGTWLWRLQGDAVDRGAQFKGESFSGSAAVALALHSARLPADPSCLIAAQYRVDPATGQSQWLRLDAAEKKTSIWIGDGKRGHRVVLPGDSTDKVATPGSVFCNSFGDALKEASRSLVELGYLTWMESQLRYITPLSATTDDTWRMRLDGVYVSLQSRVYVAAEHRRQDKRARKNQEHLDYEGYKLPPDVEELPIETLEQAVTAHPLVLITGDPGCGKTTLCKYLALRHAQTYRQAGPTGTVFSRDDQPMGTAKIPVVVRLAAYARWQERRKEKKDLNSYLLIAETLENAAGRPRYPMGTALAGDEILQSDLHDLLGNALRQGRLILLFDGLDEIRDLTLRRAIRQQLENFLEEYVGSLGNRAVVTSRIVGYGEAPLRLPSIAHRKVIPMREEQIRLFLSAWAGAAREAGGSQDLAPILIDAILGASANRIRELRENPLLLHLLASEVSLNGQLPDSRVHVYSNVIRRTLERRVGDRFDLMYGILADLGYQMLVRFSAGTMPEPQFQRFLAERINQRPSGNLDTATLANELRTQSGLLQERGGQQLSFLHLTFQEYFAGYSLLTGLYNPATTVDPPLAAARIYPLLGDSRWAVAIAFALTLPEILGWSSTERDTLLAGILAKDKTFPSGYLTLVKHLEEFGDLSADLYRSLFERSLDLVSLGDTNGIAPVATRVIRKLDTLDHSRFVENAARELGQPASPRARALARTLSTLGLVDETVARALQSAVDDDGPASQWAFQHALQRMLSQPGRHSALDDSTPAALPVLLPMGVALKNNHAWLERLNAADLPQRIVIALYGGLGDFGLAELLDQQGKLCLQLRTGDERAADSMERSKPVIDKLSKLSPQFQPDWICQDSTLSPQIVNWLGAGLSPMEWLAHLRAFWQRNISDPNPRRLADIALALTAAGAPPPVSAIPKHVQAVLADRLQGALRLIRDAYLRALPAGRDFGVESTNAVLSALIASTAEEGLAAARIDAILNVQIDMDGPPICIRGLPASAFAVRRRLADWEWAVERDPRDTDPVYSWAVVLDSRMSQLVPVAGSLVSALARWPGGIADPEPLDRDERLDAAERLIDMVGTSYLSFLGYFESLRKSFRDDPEWHAILELVWTVGRRADSALRGYFPDPELERNEASTSVWPAHLSAAIANPYERARYNQLVHTWGLDAPGSALRTPLTPLAALTSRTSLWEESLGHRPVANIDELRELAAVRLFDWSSAAGLDPIRLAIQIFYLDPPSRALRLWSLTIDALNRVDDRWWAAKQFRLLLRWTPPDSASARLVLQAVAEWPANLKAWISGDYGALLCSQPEIPNVVRLATNLLDLQRKLSTHTTTASELWLNWPEDPEKHRDILHSAHSGRLVMDEQAVVTLRAAAAGPGLPAVIELLPLFDSVDPAALATLQSWWAESDLRIRPHLSLWLLDTGLWSAETVSDALFLFENGADRERVFADITLCCFTRDSFKCLERNYILEQGVVNEFALHTLAGAAGDDSPFHARTRHLAKWALQRVRIDDPIITADWIARALPVLAQVERAGKAGWDTLLQALADPTLPQATSNLVTLAVFRILLKSPKTDLDRFLDAPATADLLATQALAGRSVALSVEALAALPPSSEILTALQSLYEACERDSEEAQVKYWRALQVLGMAPQSDMGRLEACCQSPSRRIRIAASACLTGDTPTLPLPPDEEWQAVAEYAHGRYAGEKFWTTAAVASQALCDGGDEEVLRRLNDLLALVCAADEDPTRTGDDDLTVWLAILAATAEKLPALFLSRIKEAQRGVWIARFARIAQYAPQFPCRASAGELLGFMELCNHHSAEAYACLFRDLSVVSQRTKLAIIRMRNIDPGAQSTLIEIIENGLPSAALAIGHMVLAIVRAGQYDLKCRPTVFNLVAALDRRRQSSRSEMLWDLPALDLKFAKQYRPVALGLLSDHLGFLLSQIYAQDDSDAPGL